MGDLDPYVRAVESGLQHAGFDFHEPLLVALSGGPDSSALLLASCALRESRGMQIFAAHLNHGLRDSESDLDASFARDLCEAKNVTCIVESSDVARIASESGRSIEDTARDLRYEFLARAAAQVGAGAVATAHTLDDQAETVLLRLARGSGLRGATGIRRSLLRRQTPDSPPVTVVRPLLNTRRSQAAEYCRRAGVDPRIDSSNYDLSRSRNRIRHRVLPELELVNPGAAGALARFAELAASEMEVIEAATRAVNDEVEMRAGGQVDRARFQRLPRALGGRLLMDAYRAVTGTGADLESAHVHQMLDLIHGRAGTSMNLPRGMTLRVEHDWFRLSHLSDHDDACPYPVAVREQVLPVPGSADLGNGVALRSRVITMRAGESTRDTWSAYLQSHLAEETLTLRSRRPGDRFHPLGMPGPAKLQDFLVSAHVPRDWRDRIPLVVSPRGIVWVPGCRPADWAGADGNKDTVLELKMVGPLTGRG